MQGHKLRNVYIVPWKSDVAQLLATGSKWTVCRGLRPENDGFPVFRDINRNLSEPFRSTSVYGPWLNRSATRICFHF